MSDYWKDHFRDYPRMNPFERRRRERERQDLAPSTKPIVEALKAALGRDNREMVETLYRIEDTLKRLANAIEHRAETGEEER